MLNFTIAWCKTKLNWWTESCVKYVFSPSLSLRLSLSHSLVWLCLCLCVCVCVCEHDIVWPWNVNKKNPLSDFGNRARLKTKNIFCLFFFQFSSLFLYVSILLLVGLLLIISFHLIFFVLVSLNYSDPLKTVFFVFLPLFQVVNWFCSLISTFHLCAENSGKFWMEISW